MKTLILILTLFLSGCFITGGNSRNDVKNMKDILKLEQTLIKAKGVIKKTNEPLTSVIEDSKIIIESGSGEVQEAGFRINDNTKGVIKHIKEVKNSLSNIRNRAKKIERRASGVFDWELIGKWVLWSIIIGILSYLGVLPVMISLARKLIKGCLSEINKNIKPNFLKDEDV